MSGSSVPEAARAAKWGAIFYSPVIDAKAWHYDNQGAAFISKLIEEIDAEVAAAVAEERATTGRRIEAIERLCKGIECDSTASVYGAEAKGYAKVVAVQLRAALASRGEAGSESCPGCGSSLRAVRFAVDDRTGYDCIDAWHTPLAPGEGE